MDEIRKEDLKLSPISIVELSLNSLEFKKTTSRPHVEEIPLDAIRVRVRTEEVNSLTIISWCDLTLFEEVKDASFTLTLAYQIEARISDPARHESLLRFARFGALFNVIVHARELVATLTARSFGRALMIPMVDITELGEKINIAFSEQPRREDSGASPEDLTTPPTSPTSMTPE
jgi:hypothetical protein